MMGHPEANAIKQQAMAEILSDLDRCEHGRHERDDCFGCNGPSNGNPFMHGGMRVGTPPMVPRQIGYTMGANPIVVPERTGTPLLEDWAAELSYIDERIAAERP